MITDFDWKVLDAILQFKPTGKVCAEIMGVSHDTIERRIKEKFNMTFAEYRESKMAGMKMNLSKKQYEVAMSGNVTMLIWLGKQWLDQKEKVEENSTQEIKLSYSID